MIIQIFSPWAPNLGQMVDYGISYHIDAKYICLCLNVITWQVVRDKRTGKTKGYGFVSFSNPSDLAAALKEMNGKWIQFSFPFPPLFCI